MKQAEAKRGSGRWSNRGAQFLGVSPSRKEEIYLDLDKSASLLDASYWLQIVFSSGVATLGLALNSPAVIIGAMLISPLMSPILSGGLALASGDLILGLRAGANLILSCMAAIGFSVILITFLPFKELTGEIMARTNPTTLDLAVAILSGAVGAIATCKEAKGVVTSIPGVAIAVALMPPLGVVGYGIGIAISLNAVEGMRVTRGGGLLFLTNLVAITFAAMIVFFLLRIDTASAKQRVEEWRKEDRESALVRRLLRSFPVPERLRRIDGYAARFVMILVPLLLILIPLNTSLHRLREEYIARQQEDRTHRVAAEIWQQRFGAVQGGVPRAVMDGLEISQSGNTLTLSIRAFTNDPLKLAEQTEYAKLVAAALERPIGSVRVELLQIPTTAGLEATRASGPKPVLPPPPPPSLDQLRSAFQQGIQASLSGVRLPPVAELVGYRVSLTADGAITVNLAYLADRSIDPDAQALIANEVRGSLTDMKANVAMEQIPTSLPCCTFRQNATSLSRADESALDKAGRILQEQSELGAEIIAGRTSTESAGIAQERGQSIMEYLAEKWQIGHDRFKVSEGNESNRTAMIKFHVTTDDKTAVQNPGAH